MRIECDYIKARNGRPPQFGGLIACFSPRLSNLDHTASLQGEHRRIVAEPFERIGISMPDDPILLRLLAEACRKLAGVFEEPDRKVLWIERAGHWDQLATEAERRKLREA
jgi:hypothetical protein